VLGALPRYLAELGHDVHCFIPLYGVIHRNQHGLELEISQVDTPMERWTEPAGIWKTSEESTTYFVASERYFDRDNIYGYEDDGERFIFLCRTALETV